MNNDLKPYPGNCYIANDSIFEDHLSYQRTSNYVHVDGYIQLKKNITNIGVIKLGTVTTSSVPILTSYFLFIENATGNKLMGYIEKDTANVYICKYITDQLSKNYNLYVVGFEWLFTQKS